MLCASPSKAIITSTERNPGEACSCYRRYPLSLRLGGGRYLSGIRFPQAVYVSRLCR